MSALLYKAAWENCMGHVEHFRKVYSEDSDRQAAVLVMLEEILNKMDRAAHALSVNEKKTTEG